MAGRASPSFSSSSFSYRWTYHVFLSFRGKDTRYSFTGNLFNALRERGIHTFFDNRELQPEEDLITPALVKAIEESRIVIPVFSANYASSSFCLDELVEILDRVKGKDRLVLPVFCGVEPSHVRHQRGSYGEAMAKHEKRFREDIVLKWREALEQAVNLSSKHFIFGNNEYEHEFIKKIVKVVFNLINRIPVNVTDYQVQLESPMLDVEPPMIVGLGYDDEAHMAGIHENEEIGGASSFNYGYTYGVFLNFRGKDTRTGFTGNLFSALREKGIHTFFDDQELKGGEEIRPTLFKAIEGSKVAIPVFSTNYAASSFCLDELVKIIECVKTKGRLVLPVFHGVDPSQVRYQTGSYGEAMAKHKKRFKDEIVQKWREALEQAANLSGKHFISGNEYEHEFIKNIVEVVSKMINHVPLNVADYPVGLESPVLKVRLLLDAGLRSEVRMVGIYGIGGIGKTTLARAVYNSIADHFEGLCFLENVRENSIKHGLEHLQKVLLSKIVGEKDINLVSINEGIQIIRSRLQQKNVLLVLDDVDERKQLQALAGKLDWFGSGSRVIITTRKKDLLAWNEVKATYELYGLSEENARKLFEWNAFKNKVDPGFEHIVNRAITYAAGLPLALEVIGSNLYGKEIEECESILDRYERIPEKDVQKILRISFDALEEDVQNVFLDIACCFKGFNFTQVKDTLCAHYNACRKHAIGVLVARSLIKINAYDEVTLHDLIQQMGREIVRQEGEPGERSRLWFPDDVVQVLECNKGSCKTKLIFLDLHKSENKLVQSDGKAFEDMKNLETLIVRYAGFSHRIKHLPNSLEVLEWWKYQPHFLPDDFCPKNLVRLKLHDSYLKSFSLPKMHKEFVNLRVLIFDGSQDLTNIPDLSRAPNLGELSFANCENITKIDESVGFLGKLQKLDAFGCSKLRRFPPLMLTSLQELNLSHCSSLENFPEILGKMTSITKLSLQSTAIKELPLSIRNLTQLQSFDLVECGMLQFPSSITLIPELRYVWLSGSPDQYEGDGKVSSMWSSSNKRVLVSHCNLSNKLFPEVLAWLAVNAKYLMLSHLGFTVLSACIPECGLLTKLLLDQCHNLRQITGIPPNLDTLHAKCCRSLEELDLTVFPACSMEYHPLRRLVLDHCRNLRKIRALPLNIESLSAVNCTSLTYSCISMLLNQELHEDGGNMWFFFPGSRIPEWFQHRSSGSSISFWFRNVFPAISLCSVFGVLNDHSIPFFFCPKLKINGNIVYKWLVTNKGYWSAPGLEVDHIFILDEKQMKFEDKVNEVLVENNKWNHAEISIDTHSNWGPIVIAMQTGIHVFKEKISMEDIQFSHPYKRDHNNVNWNSNSMVSTRTSSTSSNIEVRYLPVRQGS